MLNYSFEEMLILIPVLLLSLSVHEFAHGYSAFLLGDRVAKDDGRLTLNPLKHIDPIGFLMFLLVGFGWAKPVRFNPNNFKNRQIDPILTAIAGPLSNFLLSIIFVFLMKFVADTAVTITPFIKWIYQFFYFGFYINIALGVFNLLPIPPLDGSHIYMTYLSSKNPILHRKITKYGMTGLMVVIISGRYLEVDLLPIGNIIKFIASWSINLVFN